GTDMELKKNTAGKYDLLIELGILQNVKEIDSMNYGWDKRAGRLRSRKKYVGDIEAPGLVYSYRDFDHTKFSVKREELADTEGNVYPWASVFGVEEITETDAEGNEYLSFDLWLILSQEAEEQAEESYDALEPIAEEGDSFAVETVSSEVVGPKKAILEGKIPNMGDHSEVEGHFEYSKYHKETWWILADPHTAYGGDYSADDLEKAVDDTMQLGISDHAITLGDVVENRADALPSYKDEMERLDHSYNFVLGNHDVDGWWWDDEDEAPLITEPEWGSKIIAGVRFIWLSDEGDGNWEYNGGYGRKMYISDEQNEWFKLLMDEDPDIPTVIMCHQGPCEDGEWAEDIPDFWDPDERGWLRENIDQYNLIAWIHGHRHSWIIDENFGGWGFDRISIDSIDKNTDSNESCFMTVERIADKTRLEFVFRDHYNEEWTDAFYTWEYEIETNNGLQGWQETPAQTITEPSLFREQLTGLTKGEDYLFSAVADDTSGSELDRGEQLSFETMLLDLIFGKVHYDPETEAWDLIETYDKTTMRALEWGLIVEKIDDRRGSEVKLYAEEDETGGAPKSCVMEHYFPGNEWKDVMGIFGKEARIHTALGFARYEYGKSADYEDYEVEWREDGTHEGYIEMNRDQELVDHLQGGAHAFIYSHPHKKDVESTDLYGERTQLFNGYVTDLSDRDASLYMSLEGVLKDLDRDEEVVLVENIDQTAQEIENKVTPLDCFDVLKYAFDHGCRLRNFEHMTKGSEWHDRNDRPFSVNGSLLNAIVRFSQFLDMVLRARFVEEGAHVDVNVDNPRSGENMTVKTSDLAADRDENIIKDFDLRKNVGPNEYINKLRGEALLADEDEEWRTMRTNRLGRLLGDELIINEEDTMRFAQSIGSREKISKMVESELEKHEYDWTGKIEVHGHHHHLGGCNRQGTVTVAHSRKNVEREFRVSGYKVKPGSTELYVTNSARARTKPGGSELRQTWDYMLNKNVIRAMSSSTFEAWVDRLGVFDIQTVTEAKLVGEDDLDITDWAVVHTSSYHGYRYVDMKFAEEDWVGNSKDLNPDKIVLRNEAGHIKIIELPEFYKYGVWALDPDPWNTGELQEEFSIFGNIGVIEDHYEHEILEDYFVLGDISGGLGDPEAGGGVLGDPREEEYIDPPGDY
ncbi:MAG: metallophosphoesterase family protein, partial [Thermoplasmata archaeon]